MMHIFLLNFSNIKNCLILFIYFFKLILQISKNLIHLSYLLDYFFKLLVIENYLN